MTLTDILAAIRPLDASAVTAAREHQDRLTKPRGALGTLEDLSVQLAGLAGYTPPPVPARPAVAVFVGDHGVHAQGVTPWPQEVTAQMVANFLAGGAVVNVLARQAGAQVVVVDVGMATPAPAGTLERRVRSGTGDISQGPAMTRTQAEQALEVGIAVAEDLLREGCDLLVAGDMGIANTTASAALVAALTGRTPADVTGHGTGIDATTHALKVEVVTRALAINAVDAGDPLGVLACVGGLEHAAIAGFLLAAAAHRVPVVLDGVIACSAALVAQALAPDAVAAFVAGHRSSEPGASAALAQLGLEPLLDLGMRLGEGSGAMLAVPVVRAAAAVLAETATFDSAGVSDKS
jgi:nicotinate-nucleotide--dimethylbenzimidazole phosphoribosyltransferase